MRASRIIASLTAIVGLCFGPIDTPSVAGDDPAPHKLVWLRDVDEALRVARDSGRDALINFTGPGWCYSCELLEREVFLKPEFAAAIEHFVLIELDFPKDEAADDVEEAAEKNRGWKSKYLVQLFPTVVVADSSGRPVGYTGYKKGINTASFLKQIEQFRAARMDRDRAILQAAGESGSQRATSLDAALDFVAPNLGATNDLNGDALLRWYSDEIEEICRLDSEDKLRLRTKYRERSEKLQSHLKSEEPFAKLDTFKSNKDALAYIERTLPNVTDSEMAWRLEYARQVYLEWDDQNAAALDNARRLLKRSDLTRDQRESLKDRVAFNLKNLFRYEESVAELDELIAANHDRPSRKLDYTSLKAWYLSYQAEEKQNWNLAIATFQQWRAECEPNSDDWKTATWGLAIQLQKSHRFSEALALRKELIAFDATPESLLDVVESQISLGQTTEATKILGNAESLFGSIASDRPDEKERKERLARRADELKRRLTRSDESK